MQALGWRGESGGWVSCLVSVGWGEWGGLRLGEVGGNGASQGGSGGLVQVVEPRLGSEFGGREVDLWSAGQWINGT